MYALDLDHPGYLRHCAFPGCEATCHAITGPADGRQWYMGNSGPIHGSWKFHLRSMDRAA